MLSQAQAESFLVKVLKFTNWNEIFTRDKLEFIQVLGTHYAHHTYFQNISMTSTPPEERKVPGDRDTISNGIKGTGGICVVQNGFLAKLLKALGLNAYTIAGYFHGPGPRNYEDNHVICIVEFNPEEKYLIEFGVALPFTEPVPLHKLPYTSTAAGVRYQYKLDKERDDTFVRVQLDGGLFGGAYVNPIWNNEKDVEFVRYEFTLTPRPLEFFTQPLRETFADADESFLLQQPLLFRYFEEDDAGNLLDEVNLTGNRKWILIRGVSVLIGTDDTKLVTHYSTYDEMKDVILKYFPKLSGEDVEKAVGYFNESVPKVGYYRAN